jgi:NMD protein affecting ribosome stability and mRNA decay
MCQAFKRHNFEALVCKRCGEAQKPHVRIEPGRRRRRLAARYARKEETCSITNASRD